MPWRLTSEPPPTWYGHKCVVCHAGTESRKQWFDGDIEVEFEGTYLICAECIREAAHELGMLEDDKVDDLLSRALEAETQNAELETELAAHRVVIDALRRLDAASGPAPAAEPGASSPAPGPSRNSTSRRR
jgi:hypothetical protein